MRLTSQRPLQSASDGEFPAEGPFNKTIREAEEALMLAVLQDAIESFQKYALAESKRGKRLFQEAEEWILETNGDWFFSFENICEVLGLHPDYLRQGLMQWKEQTRHSRLEVRKISPAARKKAKKPTGLRAALVASP